MSIGGRWKCRMAAWTRRLSCTRRRREGDMRKMIQRFDGRLASLHMEEGKCEISGVWLTLVSAAVAGVR